MVKFTTRILKFDQQGEKTGWTYIEIPADIAERIRPQVRTSYRVKGKLDNCAIEGVALIPMGGGAFIIPLNATLRKAIGKKQGAMVTAQLEEDKKEFQFNVAFMECLADEPVAAAFFKTLSGSHQRYFSKWIDSAKTEATRIKRIAQAINGLAKKQDYGTMMRSNRQQE